MNLHSAPAATRTFCVPGDHPTLAAAILAAEPGDTIRLVAETGEDTPIRMRDGLVLESEPGVVLRGMGHRTILVIENCADVHVRGLQLEHAEGPGESEICLITNSTVEMRECVIRGAGSFGLVAKEGAQLRFYDCKFTECSFPGLVLDGPAVHAELFDCKVTDNHVGGLNIEDGADAYIERIVVSGNFGWGLRAEGPATRVTVRDGTFTNNFLGGIDFAVAVIASLSSNTISENGSDGICANGGGIVARKNLITCNDGCGIAIAGGITATLDGNTCDGNRRAGISLTGPQARVELYSNECVENDVGIAATSGVCGFVEDNVCQRNKSRDLGTAAATKLRVGRKAP